MTALTTILSQNLPTLSTTEIEAQLQGCQYRYDGHKDPAAEGSGFPPFVQPFYIWLCEHERIPTPQEHADLYFALYPWAGDGCRQGLEARLNRTWPSLVRDVHLTALLCEAGIRATYCMDWDTSAGIDLVAWPPEGSGRPGLFVHAFVGTPRAVEFRRQKSNGRRHLDLPLLRRDAAVVGNVWLYRREPHVETVRLAL